MGFWVAKTKKGRGQWIGLPCNGQLPFLHGLQQGGLSLGRSSVDFIGQNHVRKEGSRDKTELSVRVQYFRTGNIARH